MWPSPEDPESLALERMPQSCALDVADADVADRSDLIVAGFMRESEEWTRLARIEGLKKLKDELAKDGIDAPFEIDRGDP